MTAGGRANGRRRPADCGAAGGRAGTGQGQGQNQAQQHVRHALARGSKLLAGGGRSGGGRPYPHARARRLAVITCHVPGDDDPMEEVSPGMIGHKAWAGRERWVPAHAPWHTSVRLSVRCEAPRFGGADETAGVGGSCFCDDCCGGIRVLGEHTNYHVRQAFTAAWRHVAVCASRQDTGRGHGRSACRRPGAGRLHGFELPAVARRLHGDGEAPVQPGLDSARCRTGRSTTATTGLEGRPREAGIDRPHIGWMARGPRNNRHPRREPSVGTRPLQGTSCPDSIGKMRPTVTAGSRLTRPRVHRVVSRPRGCHGARRRAL
ncbi:hypothetical protein DC74_8147 [Streptomyces noursei]|nr:hypothetical protein DC74_8147 [Streptomyces noursei]